MKTLLPYKNSKKLLLSLCVFTFLFASCEKNIQKTNELKCEVKIKEGSNTSVLGKWKLVRGTSVFYEPVTYDYSCENIIYEFTSDGTLIITGDAEQNLGYGKGIYDYKFQVANSETGIYLPYMITINGNSLSSNIVNHQLELNNSSVDGPILYFLRVD